MLTASLVARYLKSYGENYRREYDYFTTNPPDGPGYPRIPISPYLDAPILNAYVATNGVAIASVEDLLGDVRPAVASMVMQLPSGATPADLGPEGPEIWAGSLPRPVEVASERVSSTDILVSRYDITLASLMHRLTFAGLQGLEQKFPDASWGFWDPIIVRNMCFGTSERPHQRLIHYLEFLFHVEPAAWDVRSSWMRAHVDIGHDYVSTMTDTQKPGGKDAMISITTGLAPRFPQFNRILRAFETALQGFKHLLETEAAEAVFHDHLKKNPMLLDISGRVESKPRFPYPPGQELHGKTYLEPDFMVIRSGYSYRLIEIESPAKRVETQKGHPTSQLTQAAFQIGEWRHYIREHYALVQGQWRGINVNCQTTVVIGRGRAQNETERKERDQMRITYGADEVLSYDELFDRAVETYRRLQGMTLLISS